MQSYSTEPITTQHTITPASLSSFRLATLSEFTVGAPPTLPTLLRATEFMWLDRVGVDLRKLLHTDQEYEYVHDLPIGEPLLITTKIASDKRKRRLRFFELRSDVVAHGKTCVSITTHFVVRDEET